MMTRMRICAGELGDTSLSYTGQSSKAKLDLLWGFRFGLFTLDILIIFHGISRINLVVAIIHLRYLLLFVSIVVTMKEVYLRFCALTILYIYHVTRHGAARKNTSVRSMHLGHFPSSNRVDTNTLSKKILIHLSSFHLFISTFNKKRN